MYKNNVDCVGKYTVRKQEISLGKRRTKDQWEETDLEESSCIFHLHSHKRKLWMLHSSRFFYLNCEHKKSKSCFCSWFIRIILPDFNERILGRKDQTYSTFSTLKQGLLETEGSSASTHWHLHWRADRPSIIITLGF